MSVCSGFSANHAWSYSCLYSLWSKSGTWWSDALSTHKKLFFFFFQLNSVERQRSILYNAVLTDPISDNCYAQLFVYLTVFQRRLHWHYHKTPAPKMILPPYIVILLSRKEGMRTCPVLLKIFFSWLLGKIKMNQGFLWGQRWNKPISVSYQMCIPRDA